jgi:hypothetical protein
LCRLVRLRLRPLSLDPFPDVGWTISQFDAIPFAEDQEFHRITVDQTDLLEIDGDGTAFVLERGAKDVQVLPSNPPAYAQDHRIFFSQHSVDSAGHGDLALPLVRHRPERPRDVGFGARDLPTAVAVTHRSTRATAHAYRCNDRAVCKVLSGKRLEDLEAVKVRRSVKFHHTAIESARVTRNDAESAGHL